MHSTFEPKRSCSTPKTTTKRKSERRDRVVVSGDGARLEDFRRRVSGRIRCIDEDEHGLTRVALARLLPGTTDSGQVSRWERGESFPNLANVQALASVFGVSEEEVALRPLPERTPRRRRRGLSD